MKDYKKLYDKTKELISDLGLALQLIHKEIGNKSWISITLDKDLRTIAKRVKSITSELHQLEAEIEKEEKTYYCSVCHKTPVDAENGYDTCFECTLKI